MGSILQFFDLTHTNSSRKLAANKRQGDGHEAPRNSLEFSIETSHNYDVIQEDIPYSCQVKQHPSKMNYRSNDAPMKRLIDEEMSKKMNNKRNSPSVVARLMGMDALPSETKPTIHAYGWKDEKPRSSLPSKEATKLSSSHRVSSLSSASSKRGRDLVPYDIKKESIQPTTGFKLAKPWPREHPQEELLQKFKKDFEAWQTSKVWENSRTPKADNYLLQATSNQILAHENLNKEKMARYWESGRYPTHKKPIRPKSYASRDKPKSIADQGILLPRESYMNKVNKQSAMTKFSEKQDRSSSPTRIVILRPSVEMSDDAERSWSGSPELLEKEVSMQDFLEEVKERLKSEILGKARNNTTAGGFTADTSFGEKPEDTKQFARHIAKQIRESVTRDLGTSLVRSESTRSYKSEFQFNGPEFPEFVSRNTRKLLSERLKNVIRNETEVDIPLDACGRSRMTHERVKSQSMLDIPKLGIESEHWEDVKPPTESKVVRGEQKDAAFDAEPTSPRNLVRSFSAPVSGTAFAKLLLQDQHVLTGAHIHPKREASEHPSPESRRRKKDGFNLKGTVSTLRQNFTLKGKFFGKKTHSVDESGPTEFDSSRALVTAPSIVAKAGSVQDNSTEVPPSPASVSSSSLDEFCRPGVPSPVSPLQASFIEDQTTTKISIEGSSINPELRHLSQHVEHDGIEEVATEECYSDDTIEAEGHAQAYIRDVLITAGLYEGEIFDEAFPKWNLQKKPIPKWVFDEVEEAYTQKGRLDEARSLFCDDGETNISRKLLFDLINEALPRVLKPTTSSMFKKWMSSPNGMPCRKKVLDDLWSQIQAYINSNLNGSNSADGMVAQDVRTDPWCTILHEDLYVTGRKMELVILDDLIDEFTSEMLTSLVREMRL